MNVIHLLIGSNVGNRQENLSRATAAIRKTIGKIVNESFHYETEAWGNKNQQAFLNQALIVENENEPEKLLRLLKDIEKDLGRKSEAKWGPRIIDIDILFMNDLIYKSERLTIPHPEIQNRKFTLVPLAEIAPDFFHPVLKKTIAELLESCKDTLKVVKLPLVNEV